MEERKLHDGGGGRSCTFGSNRLLMLLVVVEVLLLQICMIAILPANVDAVTAAAASPTTSSVSVVGGGGIITRTMMTTTTIRRAGSTNNKASRTTSRVRSCVYNSISPCSPTLQYHMYNNRRRRRRRRSRDMKNEEFDKKAVDGDVGMSSSQIAATSSAGGTDDDYDYNQITKEVEEWAIDLLSQNDVNYQIPRKYHGSDEGGYWYELKCRKPHKFNANGETKLFLNWMKDSRGIIHARKDDKEHDNDVSSKTTTSDKKLHPCMKIISTIHAPLEDVCLYLSQPNHYRDYNTLLVNVLDIISDLSVNSKLCWGQTPKLCK